MKKIDRLILIAIAIALWIQILKPIVATDAQAKGDYQNVNIAAVGNRAVVYGQGLPVKVLKK